MKEINLFVDFEFTSLSPDAQPISVGIVSEGTFKNQNSEEFKKYVEILNSALFNPDFKVDPLEAKKIEEKIFESSKSFYAEFSDFDINRCDDWVKENVVGKLTTNLVAEKLGISFECAKDAAKTSTNWSREYCILKSTENEIALVGNTWRIKEELKNWLSQFSDYQITFVVDCGTWDWYHLLQLIGEWEETKGTLIIEESALKECTEEELVSMFRSSPTVIKAKYPSAKMIPNYIWKLGLPIISSNISPVPFELNQFIAEKKGISVREAFELDREELAFGFVGNVQRMVLNEWHEQDMAFFGFPGEKAKNDKHNALFDARVMKAIYEKLIV